MLKIYYECEGSKKTYSGDLGCEDFFVEIDKSNGVYVKLRAVRPIKIIKAEYVFDYYFTDKSKTIVNCYQ